MYRRHGNSCGDFWEITFFKNWYLAIFNAGQVTLFSCCLRLFQKIYTRKSYILFTYRKSSLPKNSYFHISEILEVVKSKLVITLQGEKPVGCTIWMLYCALANESKKSCLRHCGRTVCNFKSLVLTSPVVACKRTWYRANKIWMMQITLVQKCDFWWSTTFSSI